MLGLQRGETVWGSREEVEGRGMQLHPLTAALDLLPAYEAA
jgi:hypothetical protein